MRALVLAGLLVAAPAQADAILVGSVVKVEHSEIYVNLGDAQGVKDGAALRIKRTIRLRHPVNRTPVNDWVPVGSATVTQAGARLSRAILGDLIDIVRVGDNVEVLIERVETPPRPAPAPPPPPTPTAPPAPPPPAPPPIDPATTEVLAAFTAQSGASLDARIAGWERYLSTHGSSKFAAAVRADLESLQALRDQLRPVAPGGQHELIANVDHSAPLTADAGKAFPVVFVLERPDRVASAYLHYRTRDSRTYTRVLLHRENELYLRGSLPAGVVKSPGVDYFVEVSAPDGRTGLALGSPATPTRVEVKAPPITDELGALPGRTSIALSGEYLDFATFDKRTGDRRDSLFSANVDIGYRLDTAVQRVGVGYGVIGGVGGSEDLAWDAMLPLPKTGFHYGSADVELGRRELAFGGKVIAGVNKRGFGMGVEGRGRVGEHDGTNLTVRAVSMPEIGWLTDIRFGARPVRDLAIGVSVGATNQPRTEDNDTAVKLGTELEFVRFASVSILVRGSWQGRSTAHGGLGGGGSLRFTW